jgi:hypothetical protein
VTGDGPWQSGASGDGDAIALGLPKPNHVDKSERAEEGEREEQKGAAERSGFTEIWSFVLPVMAESGEELCGLAASLRRGKERDERGACGGLIGRVLMAVTARGVSGGRGVTPAVTVPGREGVITGEEESNRRDPPIGEREKER